MTNTVAEKTIEQIRAQEVLDYLEAHPERHDQSLWTTQSLSEVGAKPARDLKVCDTTMCVAGTVVFLEALANDTSIADVLDVDPNGYFNEERSYARKGAELLGLNDEDAWQLFYNKTDEQAVEDLRRLAAGQSIEEVEE